MSRERNTLFRDFDAENQIAEFDSFLKRDNEWVLMGAFSIHDKDGNSLPMDGRKHRHVWTDGTIIETVNVAAGDVKSGDKVFIPGQYTIHTSDGRGNDIWNVSEVPTFDERGRQDGTKIHRALDSEKDFGFTRCRPITHLQVITNYTLGATANV